MFTILYEDKEKKRKEVLVVIEGRFDCSYLTWIIDHMEKIFDRDFRLLKEYCFVYDEECSLKDNGNASKNQILSKILGKFSNKPKNYK